MSEVTLASFFSFCEYKLSSRFLKDIAPITIIFFFNWWFGHFKKFYENMFGKNILNFFFVVWRYWRPIPEQWRRQFQPTGHFLERCVGRERERSFGAKHCWPLEECQEIPPRKSCKSFVYLFIFSVTEKWKYKSCKSIIEFYCYQ